MLRAILLALTLLSSNALAQEPQVSGGLVCDTPGQVQEVLEFKGESRVAVSAVNAKHGDNACGLAVIMFTAGPVVANGEDQNGKSYEVLRVLVLAAHIDGKVVGLNPPITQYIPRLINEVKA